MSDIQLYTTECLFFHNDGDFLGSDEHLIVKYDDHIAECERRYELWQKKYKDRTEELQVRIDELEKELTEHVKIPMAIANEIKKEGITEMLEQFDMKEMHGCEGEYLSVNLMYEYARQLENNDE